MGKEFGIEEKKDSFWYTVFHQNFSAILSRKLAFFHFSHLYRSLRVYEIHAPRVQDDPQDFIFVYCVYIQIYPKVNVMSFIRLDGSFSNHLAVTLQKPHIFTPINILQAWALKVLKTKRGRIAKSAKKRPWTPTFITEMLHIFQAFFKRHSQ